ncbi:TPA: antitoxin VapB family protein [archaeon]|nr:antitoxin VapB family protein [Candidatus Naiadarchaeales archaeon SRR2090153.bin461]
MATKTLSITEEAYERLSARKEPLESFSDVIIKITGRASLAELAGVLSRKEAAELRANIAARRKALRERLRKTARILE